MAVMRVPNFEKRRKELEDIKSIYGVTGFSFYYRPTIVDVPGGWFCSKIQSHRDDIIELTNTHPSSLQSLLDGLLNLEDANNRPQVKFGGHAYNNLEDLWKAMGKI